MRKGYGPTGLSYGYPFITFKNDVAQGREFKFEVVLKGNSFAATFDLSSCTISELRAFYDSADTLHLTPDGSTVLTLYT